jgi:hypothetical protein
MAHNQSYWEGIRQLWSALLPVWMDGRPSHFLSHLVENAFFYQTNYLSGRCKVAIGQESVTYRGFTTSSFRLR